jgi:hypothetical protein
VADMRTFEVRKYNSDIQDKALECYVLVELRKVNTF